MKARHPDVLVLGGGIIGLLTALELLHAGLDVRVLDEARPAQAASHAAAGILAPLPPWAYPPPVDALARQGRRDWPALLDELGLAQDASILRTPGMLVFGAAPETARDWARRSGERLEFLDAAELRRLEPALGAAARAGLWLPDVARLETAPLLQRLRERLAAAGVLRADQRVLRLERTGERIAAVRTARDRLTPGRVVLAAGAWSGALAATAGLELPVEPVKGEILCYAGPSGLARILLEDGRYLLPRADGSLLVGSTRERSGFEARPSEAARATLEGAARRLLPAVAGLRVVGHWAGLRPGSHDELPYIGPWPGLENLWLNTGHYTTGITVAPAAAGLLADSLLDRARRLDERPYLPARLLAGG